MIRCVVAPACPVWQDEVATAKTPKFGCVPSPAKPRGRSYTWLLRASPGTADVKCGEAENRPVPTSFETRHISISDVAAWTQAWPVTPPPVVAGQASVSCIVFWRLFRPEELGECLAQIGVQAQPPAAGLVSIARVRSLAEIAQVRTTAFRKGEAAAVIKARYVAD